MGNFLSPVQAVLTMLGVVFILAMLSLLVSVLMETAAILLNTRARRLFSAIQELLQQDRTLFDQFVRHPRFRQIAGPAQGLSNAPQYLPADSFADIFLELLQLRGLGARDAELSEVTALDTFLKSRFDDCGRDTQAFKKYLAKWYSEKMFFASGVYRKRIRYQLFFISLIVAVLFGADIMGVYSRIGASFRKSPMESITAITQNLDRLVAIDPSLRDSLVVKKIESQLLAEMEESLAPTRKHTMASSASWPQSPFDWLKTIAGFFVSALLMAYGAQFWFSVVSKIIHFKKSGAPASASAESKTID